MMEFLVNQIYRIVTFEQPVSQLLESKHNLLFIGDENNNFLCQIVWNIVLNMLRVVTLIIQIKVAVSILVENISGENFEIQ